MAGTRTIGQVATPLRYPAFRRLWLGLVASRLGDQFTIVALLWFVLQLTGSGAALGLVTLCFTLPTLVTGPLLGQLLDRHQPRFIMAGDNALRALIIGAIPALYYLGALHLWHIYVLALLAGALSPATQVGVRIVLPQLVSDGELESANALSAVSFQFASLAGPAVAGVMTAAIGGPTALLVDAASFVVMAGLVVTLPNLTIATGRRRRATATTGPRTWLGFGPLFRLKEVRVITLISLVFFLAYGPLEPALPVYSQETLHAGASGYGLLWSFFGAGTLLGLFGFTGLISRLRPGITFAAIAVLWGALLAPLAISTSLLPALIFFALAGSAWGPYTTIEMSLIQRLVPESQRGQVFGARTTIIGIAATSGPALGGLLLSVVSAPVVIAISAIACIVTGFVGLCSPTLRAVRRPSQQTYSPIPECNSAIRLEQGGSS